MLLSRQSYRAEEEWERLRNAVDSVRAIAAKHNLKLEAPRSARLPRIKDEIEASGRDLAETIRREAFEAFGELGDRESLHIFELDKLPSTLGPMFVGLATSPTNVAESLASSEVSDRDEEWYLLERSGDGDTLTFLRRYVYTREVRDPVSGTHLETRTEDREIDFRLDRKRKAILVSNASDRDARKLARAAVTHAVGSGFDLEVAPHPALNAAVLHALVDSFDGRPAMTDVSPTDTELLPWKKIGARQVDIRKHPTLATMMDQGEQTALTGTFPREQLGGTNDCPRLVTIEVRTDWTIVPHTYVEPQMLIALYDRLTVLSRYSRLLKPIGRAVHDRLLQQLGARLTTGRTEKAVAAIRRALGDLDIANRPSGGSAQELFDAVVLNMVFALSDCPKAKGRGGKKKLRGNALDAIFDEALRGTGETERSRVRTALEELVSESADYLELAKRGEKMLAGAGC